MNELIITLFDLLINKYQDKFYKSNNINEQKTYFFKIKALNNIIFIIKNLDFQISSPNDISNIHGIGKKTLDRVSEIIQTGKLKELDTYNSIKQQNSTHFKKYIKELTQIFGIGYKKAIYLIHHHNITNIDQLKTEIHNNNIKVPTSVKIGIKYHDIYKDHIPRKEMNKIDRFLHKIAGQTEKHLFGIMCGSYRREKMFSNDIDFLIVHPKIKTLSDLNDIASNKHNYMHIFIKNLIKCKFIVDSLTNTNAKSKYMGFCKYKNNHVRRIDIRFVPFNSYYCSLLYFTGSSTFNTKIRKIALESGYKLNEYELVNVIDNKQYNITSEKQIFDILNIDYVEPKLR